MNEKKPNETRREKFVASCFVSPGQIAMAKIDAPEGYVTVEEWQAKISKRVLLINRAVYDVEEARSITEAVSLGALEGRWREASSQRDVEAIVLYHVVDKSSDEIIAMIYLPPAELEEYSGQVIIAIKEFKAIISSDVVDDFEQLRRTLSTLLRVPLDQVNIKENAKYTSLKSRYIDLKSAGFCIACGMIFKNRDLFKCGRCQYITYCSSVCQKRDWRSHKKQCHPTQKIEPKAITENVTERPLLDENSTTTNAKIKKRKKKTRDLREKNNDLAHDQGALFVSGEGYTAEGKGEEASKNNEVQVEPFVSAYGDGQGEKTKKKRVKIPKLVKKVWHDTRKKSKTDGDDETVLTSSCTNNNNSTQNSVAETASESFWEVSVTDTEASVSMSERDVSETANEVKRVYRKLYRAINKQGINYRSQITPSKMTILATLIVLQEQGLAKITSLDDEKISVTKTGEPLLFEAHTTHASGKNKNWWDNKDVRRSFLDFVASCDPLVDMYLRELFGKL